MQKIKGGSLDILTCSHCSSLPLRSLFVDGPSNEKFLRGSVNQHVQYCSMQPRIKLYSYFTYSYHFFTLISFQSVVLNNDCQRREAFHFNKNKAIFISSCRNLLKRFSVIRVRLHSKYVKVFLISFQTKTTTEISNYLFNINVNGSFAMSTRNIKFYSHVILSSNNIFLKTRQEK